jgi:hypothetical protein
LAIHSMNCEDKGKNKKSIDNRVIFWKNLI